MRFLITGHTGFKGAWLTLMLLERGHQVSGISLEPAPGAFFTAGSLPEVLEYDLRRDIRDFEGLRSDVAMIAPDVVVHMAAQPLVRASYSTPRATVETNVIGTMNVLDAIRALDCVQAQVIVTTDKVYRNIEQEYSYVESDPLGGQDPYSASKAAADLLTQSWVASFPGPPTATVRAGNVIGGGDVSADRLLPDLLRAFKCGETSFIRYPSAIRPWQHVLDCLTGYLAVVDALLAGSGQGEWNFGPGQDGMLTVGEVADSAVASWNAMAEQPLAQWKVAEETHPLEAQILALNANKAERDLNWRNRLTVQQAIDWTISWSIQVGRGKSARNAAIEQIRMFSQLD